MGIVWVKNSLFANNTQVLYSLLSLHFLSCGSNGIEVCVQEFNFHNNLKCFFFTSFFLGAGL